MKVGIVGMPNAGKTSLFTALTGAAAEAANYPFTTIEPNVAVVPVADPRLDAVAETIGASKVVPDTIAFHDIAGLVAGAHRGEGLGNQRGGRDPQTLAPRTGRSHDRIRADRTKAAATGALRLVDRRHPPPGPAVDQTQRAARAPGHRAAGQLMAGAARRRGRPRELAKSGRASLTTSGLRNVASNGSRSCTGSRSLLPPPPV